jgi:hypothetical protein
MYAKNKEVTVRYVYYYSTMIYCLALTRKRMLLVILKLEEPPENSKTSRRLY